MPDFSGIDVSNGVEPGLQTLRSELLFMIQRSNSGNLLTRWRVSSDEVGDHLTFSQPTNSFEPIYVIEYAFMHQQDLRPTADIGVHSHGENRIVEFPVYPIKLVQPKLFYIAGTDEPMAVRCFLDEHHGRQVVEIPTYGYLYKCGGLPPLERFHPAFSGLGEVYLVPSVPDADVVGLEIVVH